MTRLAPYTCQRRGHHCQVALILNVGVAELRPLNTKAGTNPRKRGAWVIVPSKFEFEGHFDLQENAVGRLPCVGCRLRLNGKTKIRDIFEAGALRFSDRVSATNERKKPVGRRRRLANGRDEEAVPEMIRRREAKVIENNRCDDRI
jgi:hypothetical protein